MTSKSRTDSAAAEMVGALVLIALFVAAIAIIAVVLFSQPAPDKIPAVSMAISNQSTLVTVAHAGGDALVYDEILVRVDGMDVPSGDLVCHKCGSDLSVGDTIQIDLSGDPRYSGPNLGLTPNKVDVIYIKGGVQHQLMTTRYLGTMAPTPTPGTIPTTATPVYPPVADFTGTPLTGPAPLVVSFTDTSTNSPTSWSWDFGDGGTSSSRNPAHTYTSEGTFTVTMTATNSAGSDSVTKSNYITVSGSLVPDAQFVANPLNGTAPLTVTFTDASTNTPTSWNWSFGDGTYSENQNPAHVYSVAGTYTVILRATNAFGSDTGTGAIIATEEIIPGWGYVDLDADKGGYVTSGSSIQFTILVGSSITHGGVPYPLDAGDEVELIFTENSYGTAHIGTFFGIFSWIDDFTFSDVRLIINGIDIGTGDVTAINVFYSDFTSNMNIDVPCEEADTYLDVSGDIIISGSDNSRIQVFGLTPYYLSFTGIDLFASATQITYTGGASGYLITPYVPGPPAVTLVSPSSGPVVGGTSVTITGTDFSGATAVMFGSNAATINSVTATSISATSPAGSLGTVHVTVTTPRGTSATTSSDEFTYTPPPVVTGVSPSSGPAAGGTSVTITGTDFTGATAVMFGSNAATINSVTATSISATSPAGAAGTTVHVTVTTPSGTSATTSSDEFTYLQPPVVTGIAPSHGEVEGGTTVTITGTNLDGATVVLFGSNAATINSVTATSISATSPPGGGTVHITVTTPGGTSATSSSDQFSYYSIRTFTSSESWTVPDYVTTAECFVVAGGGGGGQYGGGGGAGGVVTGTISLTAGSTISITVGTGGTGGGRAGTSNGRGNSGSNSQIVTTTTTITAVGGGGGGSRIVGGTDDGRNGGSGGGSAGTAGDIGLENQNPNQGNNGGDGFSWGGGAGRHAGGGGGGGGAIGGIAARSLGGNGGNGAVSSITGLTYAGGGGGGSYDGSAGSGGSGGGGPGGAGNNAVGTPGTANTGGGGGGGGRNNGYGGAGGSGIVIIRYS